jgi:hypothetical protein
MRGRLLLLAALLALALSAPAAAAAERPLPLPPVLPSRVLAEHGGPVRPAPIFRSGFVGEADGYKFGVSTFGSAVVFEVWRGGEERGTFAAYLARGVAAPERLQATFGRFGKVSMRFRESRNRSRSRKKVCRFGQAVFKRRGVFVGNLRFEGEDGYLSVRLHRAKGAVVTPAGRCRFRRPPGDSSDSSFREFISIFFHPEGALLAIARDGVDSTSLLALEGKRKSYFLASDEETRGKLAIMRVATLLERSPLEANTALTSASLSPPAPFHGTGRYSAAPDGTNTWSGNLSVNFPGAPRLPLTGPEFETFLETPF